MEQRGKTHTFPVAIVGIGCRMPGGVTTPEEFWDVLVQGRDMVSEIPPDRWSIKSFYNKNQSVHSKMVTKRCGFIHDIDKFDNSFFQISPREAASMDPQQRHMLEVTYEAFQDAGIVPSACAESCGVYIAVGRMDYPIMIMDTAITNPYTLTGIAHSVVANRISYVFNFKGPSMVVDTACASSFTAMHLACCALWNGECTLAVAGGANPVIIPEVTVGYSALGVLSPEGMSCPFSDTAKGYVRSEGWGSLILKPLDAALLDNDHIYGVIQGSAIASNGASKSLTMPCCETQKMVMRMAYERFDIPMSSVQYVEAHGTGTPVGDPIEAQAIGETFGCLNKEPIRIGSVKSNFGHTECASGITSAIKVLLMLEKKQLVPSINFNKINPSINQLALNISVQTRNEPIQGNKKPYTVGLNSFGFAGAVAHMIFQEAPKEISKVTLKSGWKFGDDHITSGKYTIIPLSAKCPEALKDLAVKWQSYRSDLDALQVAAWQAARREHHAYRLAIVADSSETFRKALAHFLQGESTDTIVTGEAVQSRPKICFVFPGQGQQWYNMGRQLYNSQPIFRDTINDCDNIFKRLCGWSLLEKTGVFNNISTKKSSAHTVETIEILQPSVHFLQIGLFHLWKHWGVYPDMVLGHSLGEVAAAYAANALSLEEAVSVVYYRSLQQGKLAGTGSMAVLRSTIETAQSLCKSHPDVYIAAINSTSSMTLSGDCDQISDIVDKNPDKTKKLRVSAAFHSPFMNSIETQFRRSMENVIKSDTNNRTVPFYSSVTGRYHTGTLDVDYWWDNIRKPVFFQSATESVLEDTDVTIFLEVAATATLRSDVQKTCYLLDPLRDVTVITSNRRNANDHQYALLALGSMYTSGVEVSWKKATQNATHWASVPTYPWQHQQSLWIESEERQKVRLGQDDRSFKGKNGNITLDTFPFLSEYYEDGNLVFPSTGFIEYVTEIVFDHKYVFLENVYFNKILTWSSNSSQRLSTLKLEMKKTGHQIEVTANGNNYFQATVAELYQYNTEQDKFDVDEILTRCTTVSSKKDFYQKLQAAGITNGGTLEVVEKVCVGNSESLVYLGKSTAANTQQTFIARLNAVFQASIVTAQQPTIKCRPVSVDSLSLQSIVFTDDDEKLMIYINIVDCDGRYLTSDVHIIAESGFILGKMKNLKFCNLDRNSSAVDIQKWLYTTQLQPSSARNLPTSVLTETFKESEINLICGKDVEAITRAEDVADDIEDVCVSYITHALQTVPEIERAKPKRYHKYMATFDAIATTYTKDIIPFNKIPEVMDRILTHCPELEVEMRLTKRLGEALPDTLRNPRTAVPIMFAPDCLDRYFWDGLSMKTYYMAAADTVVRSVKEALKTKQVVRILELGARIGGMTRFIVEPLKQLGMENRLEYVFTDVSATFFRQAQKKLSDYPFIQYQVLSIDKDVINQGFVSGSFDIVICLDTLHVAIDARRSTGFMSDLLTQEGLLYIIEGTNTHYLTELWFGTMDVCLVFEDDRKQICNKSCWLNRENWMAVMRDIGLQDIVSASSTNEFYHSVMVGKKSNYSPAKVVDINYCQTKQLLVLDSTDQGIKPAPNKNNNKPDKLNRGTTIREEIALAYDGTLKVENVSKNSQLSEKFEKIIHSVQIVYIHNENEDDMRALLNLFQIVELFSSKVSRLWVVVITQNKVPDPNSASALGLAQSVGNRISSVPVYSIQVDATCKPKRVAEDIMLLLSQTHVPDHQLFISQDSLQVPRIKQHQISMYGRKSSSHWQVQSLNTSDHKGDMSSTLGFYDVRKMDVPLGDIKVRIQSIPLTSTDNVICFDTSADITHPITEILCIGVVEEISTYNGKTSHVKIGEEVIAFGQIPFASHVVCDAKLVIPKTLDYKYCFGLIPMVSAYYSLQKRAQLKPNETVLINYSDDSVCRSAIAVAKSIGCNVICTYTTDQMEHLLKEKLCVARIINTSSRSFKEAVLKWTDYKGVDVVFVSASIRDNQKILEVMSPEGRLCDTSKGRALQIAGTSSSLLMENKVFHTCQIDVLLKHRPEYFLTLVHEVLILLEDSQLHPIPHVACEINDFIQNYTKYLKETSKIGQVVLQIPKEYDPPDVKPALNQFLPNASYIVTNGNGALAQALARWLYRNGANSIVLVSTTAAVTASASQTARYLRCNGVELQEYMVNLEEVSDVKCMLHSIRSSRPIKGIFHLDTMINDNGLFDPEKASQTISSTVTRAQNLHTLTQQDSLDIFLTLSSITAVCGLPSKPVLTATNAYLDALAEQRYADGLPALSIQVGPMSCMGSILGESEAKLLNMQSNNRQQLLQVDEFLQALGQLLKWSNNPVVCLGNQDWGTMKQLCPNSAMKFLHLAKDIESKDKERSTTMNSTQIERLIKSKMAELLGMRLEAIDTRRPMTAYGVDSLIAMEIANWASDPDSLGLGISQFDILDGMTIATLLKKTISDKYN